MEFEIISSRVAQNWTWGNQEVVADKKKQLVAVFGLSSN